MSKPNNSPVKVAKFWIKEASKYTGVGTKFIYLSDFANAAFELLCEKMEKRKK